MAKNYHPQDIEFKWPHSVRQSRTSRGKQKTYRPWEIEPKWQKCWEKARLNQAEDFGKKPKFYGLVEWPYISGEGLHIGHAFTFTIQDILVRKKRMEGYNVLHPIGWDAFGLPTENYAVKTGIHPATIAKNNADKFRKQIKSLGLSYDWNRETGSADPDYYRWTQWIFLQFFKHGLAYKEETPVGWCPSCKIILANEEIVAGKCERCGATAEYRKQKQWLLRITAYADRLADELDSVDYPDYVKKSQRDWIGRKEWVDITYPIEGIKETITVSTTRPDTNFGATFVVVAPEHPLVTEILNSNSESSFREIPAECRNKIKKYVELSKSKSELERISEAGKKTGVFTGLYAVNQLNGYKMPIWVTDFVLMTVGTGAVVGVPGHDLRDFEFAQQFGLSVVRVVVGKDGDRSPITGKEQVQEEQGTMINSEFLNGLTVQNATKKIMDYLEKKGCGKRAVRYHLRDWIFSRQHYWGEPIPMVYCEACAKKGISWWETQEGKEFLNKESVIRNQGNHKIPNSKFIIHNSQQLAGWFPVPENELPLELPKVEKYQPTDTGESPLANIKEWVQTECPNCSGPARRETDTMPNWAGSSWYYLRYCDPKNNNQLADPKKLSYWMPVDVYLGGAEHTTLHLLYSRFWHKFLNDIGLIPGKEPYAARRQHGVILGEDGFRMSKSRGNVINPNEVIDKFGADTLRIYLMFMGPYESTMPWDTRGVEGGYRFLCRIWGLISGKVSKRETDLKLKSKLHQTIKKVGGDIDSLKHNTAISALMEFINEWSKKGSLSEKDAEIFLRLLGPFSPYISEELWQSLRDSRIIADKRADKRGLKSISANQPKNQRQSAFLSIHQQPWPGYDPKLVEEEKVIIIVQVNGKLRGQIPIRIQKTKDRRGIEELARKNSQVAKHLENRKIKKVVFVPGRLINFVV